MEGIAQAGGICISDDAQRQVRGKVEITFDDLGPQALKNIVEPMRVWRAQIDGLGPPTPPSTAQPLALPDKPSIAVLPFQNMSGDPEQEYFTDGVVEDIIAALSRFKSLFVIARNSSFTYKGKAVDIKQVGRELGVRYVLEGSVRKAGARLRITGQLIETSTGAHLWADKFDGAAADVFDLQDQITASVVGVLWPKIEQAEIDRANKKPTDKLDSYDLFLRGGALLSKRKFADARRLYQKAYELDPHYAAAYAAAARTYLGQLGVDGLTLTAEMQADALNLANIAAGLDNEDAMVLAICAHTLVYIGREFDRGRSMAERATALNPNNAEAWRRAGWVSIMCAEPAQAIESFERMLRLNPLDPSAVDAACGISWGLFYLSRYEDGCARAMNVMQVFRHVQSLGAYIANSVGAGQTAQAKSLVPELLKLDPEFCIKRALDVFPIRLADCREKLASAFRGAGLLE